ncbi:MAG: polyprenyl synthetase family protein [Acetobacterium sp.]
MIDNKLSKKVEYSLSLEAVKGVINQNLLQTDEIFSEIMQHLTQENGKNLRAMLLLVTSIDGDGFVPHNAVVAAASLEILHLATLVHDDVIDESQTRRGQLSVQSRFGKKQAVICGDYLFCQCFSMVAEISADYPDKFKEFSGAMTKICIGELRQFKHNADTELSVRQYLEIIAGKTSALFSLAMYSGAILNDANEKDARFMGRIGFRMGMIFQILDDCADYEGNFAVAKKSVKHDLAEDVITLPLIYAFLKNPELKTRIQNQKLSLIELHEIIAEVKNLGGVSMALDLAEKYYFKTKKMIDALPDQKKRVLISDILEKIWKGAK